MSLCSGFSFSPHLRGPLSPVSQGGTRVCTSPGDKRSCGGAHGTPPLRRGTRGLASLCPPWYLPVLGPWQVGPLTSPHQCHWLSCHQMLDTRDQCLMFHIIFITILRKIQAFENTLIIISILQRNKMRINNLKEIQLCSSKASSRKWGFTSSKNSKKEACVLRDFWVLGPLLLRGLTNWEIYCEPGWKCFILRGSKWSV